MWAEEARMDVIRLIASDLDATLLDDQSQLPPDFLFGKSGAFRMREFIWFRCIF